MAYLFTNDQNCISTGLRADIMRSSMEDKNLLEGQGSIYVGTGTKNLLADGTQVMKTKELKVDSAAGKVLMSNGSDLVYSKLTNASFDSSTRYPNLKLVNGDGSTVSGLTLSQDASTGYISLTGYIDRLTSSDGSSVLLQAGIDANNQNIVLANNTIKMAPSTDALLYYGRSEMYGSDTGVYIGKNGISVYPSSTGYTVRLDSGGVYSEKGWFSEKCQVGSKYPILFGSSADSTHRVLVCGTISSVKPGTPGSASLRSSGWNIYGISSIDYVLAVASGSSASSSGYACPCRAYFTNDGTNLTVYVKNECSNVSISSDFTYFALCTRDS